MTIGAYSLPSLWGESLPSVEGWGARRRHILSDFGTYVYGRTPSGGGVDEVVIHSVRHDALDGEATRIEARIVFRGPQGRVPGTLLIYAPSGARGVATFLGFNMRGNHTVSDDGDVTISESAARIYAEHGMVVPPRGAEAGRWPLRTIIRRGYAVATMWYEEAEIDLPGFASEGVRGMFEEAGEESWGALGAWAWTLSRLLDALASFEEIDPARVIAVGHSRLGKAALWASAQDERFAGVVSNESGCGGASLFRHRGVEDIRVITSARPHWFAGGFAHYRDREESLPVDQHQLIALQAPRPTHVGSAREDAGADPYGEFLATVHASPVFELFGLQGTVRAQGRDPGGDVTTSLALSEPFPVVDQRIGGQLSYHLREGQHGMLDSDWRHILDFADSTLRSGPQG